MLLVQLFGQWNFLNLFIVCDRNPQIKLVQSPEDRSADSHPPCDCDATATLHEISCIAARAQQYKDAKLNSPLLVVAAPLQSLSASVSRLFEVPWKSTPVPLAAGDRSLTETN